MRLKPTILLLFFFLASCGEETVYTPKPRTYPRIIFPEKGYKKMEASYCNFTFEYPAYAKVVQDTLFFNERPAHPCWFDLILPDFNGQVHFTYEDIQSKKEFESLIGDAFKLTGKHNVKADYIDEFAIQKPNGVSGFVFSVDGPAASPFQFYLTDSTNHFLRGALYFKTQARPDSLKPIVDHVKKDLMHLINTFEWE